MGPSLGKSAGGVCVQPDHVSAPSAALKLCSPKPFVNVLATEVALKLEMFECNVTATSHIGTKVNVIADSPSRVHEGRRSLMNFGGVQHVEISTRANEFQS